MFRTLGGAIAYFQSRRRQMVALLYGMPVALNQTDSERTKGGSGGSGDGRRLTIVPRSAVCKKYPLRVVCAHGEEYAMTTFADHTVWQDVYHADTPNGKVAYIKITERSDGAPVIQFKEK